MLAPRRICGLTAATAIGLLIFCGAAGKSGQVPLHVWLPDAMEGPTPVSALIHAATMVAAGVFLIARVYPLHVSGARRARRSVAGIHRRALHGRHLGRRDHRRSSPPLIAVAQNDIKRILAYSTVSQLGYMMMGLGVGGVAVGMFHLITHAFFKALLFLGAGSVIHGCHDEQDIRRMGGLRKYMPITFATYAVGMLALCGFPLFFSGFWSKDAILDAAHMWQLSTAPFYMRHVRRAADGVLHDAPGLLRLLRHPPPCTPGHPSHHPPSSPSPKTRSSHGIARRHPHESPAVMTAPLVILAVFAMLLGFLGTPAWPWFQSFLDGTHADFDGFTRFLEPGHRSP